MHICLIYSLFFFFFSISCFFFSINLLLSEVSFFIEYEFLNFNSSLILMTFYLDWMSLMFMSFVFFISSMVIHYSRSYMMGDEYINRFILLVVLFVVSMMFLIVSPNLISILLGWDGLGLVSYCLVIYYQNNKSYNAGMLTALTNRLGDVALLLAIAWMMNYGSWNFIFYLSLMKGDLSMLVVSVLIILAAITKSAQIPFSSWLPAAMAAPTPVSSLVHSSTLVTAGVYLLIRFSSCFEEWMMYIMLFISSMTMFMAGLGANFEFDLKKIIALSTLSQLGLMMSILFLGDSCLAFFHLLAHALFKALLFMCAGAMIHGLFNCQDIRYMGGVIYYMPLTCIYFNICNMSLCGMPFLSGFYSKDLIAEALSMGYLNLFIYFIFFMSIGLTMSYSMRLSYYVGFSTTNLLSLSALSDDLKMLKSMTGLIFLVVFMGSVLSWVILTTPYIIFLPLNMKIMAFLMMLLGAWLGYEFSLFSIYYSNLSFKYKNLSFFFSSMWYMPYISTFGVNYYPLVLGSFFMKNLDQGWSEYYGARNIYVKFKVSSQFLQLLFSNNLKIYMVSILVWLVFALLI
uniref:NADH-ubiquinone oxidoreductase chain 5 n=1 Tax=Mordellochroa milleri TaxID=1588259 RepID=A0A343C1P9_9CUCU|nr:NADH dehydrogenase subunit 5 [Mordellochroa milleri]